MISDLGCRLPVFKAVSTKATFFVNHKYLYRKYGNGIKELPVLNIG